MRVNCGDLLDYIEDDGNIFMLLSVVDVGDAV